MVKNLLDEVDQLIQQIVELYAMSDTIKAQMKQDIQKILEEA